MLFYPSTLLFLNSRIIVILPTCQFDPHGQNDRRSTRWDYLFSSLNNNPKAKFVTRAVQIGSQTLSGDILSVDDLATQITTAKRNLTSLGILVTTSETVAGYQSYNGAPSVLNAIDFVDLTMLPYFSSTATTADNSWGFIQDNLDWITSNVNGKKIILSKNSWPEQAPPSTTAVSPTAVASLQQMQDYFGLLDSNCVTRKSNAGGGVAWFAHVYSLDQEINYGILKDGQPQFPFSPHTSC